VLKAREMHLAGATVLRGPMGFGKSSRLHTAKILRLSMDLPLVIEIVDSEEKINSFLPVLDEMMGGGLVTLEKVRVIDYRADVEIRRRKLDCQNLYDGKHLVCRRDLDGAGVHRQFDFHPRRHFRRAD
jgi:PII-like signaling protein